MRAVGREDAGSRGPGEPASLSVVVIARNEAETIGPTLDRVVVEPPDELVVVDGDSADATAAEARRRGARVVSTAPGRARQLNAGARATSGACCLFLHADTRPPPGYRGVIARTLARPGTAAGAFPLRIDGRGAGLRLVEAAVAARSRALAMPYGDQGLFLRRSTLDALGGFPVLAAMEDLAMIRRVRTHGRIAIAGRPALTSARRWQRWGVVRTTLVHQALLAAYWRGVPPGRIAQWRANHPRPAEILGAALLGREGR